MTFIHMGSNHGANGHRARKPTGEGDPLAGRGVARQPHAAQFSMKVLPEKVEGKIFVLILIISVSVTLLAARLIAMSQESLVLSTNQTRLSARTARAQEVIGQALALRETHARAAHDRIVAALERPMPDDDEDYTLLPSDVRTSGTSRERWSLATQKRVASVADSLSGMRSLITADFPRYFVHLENDGVTLHIAQSRKLSGVEGDFKPVDLTPAMAARNPGREPVWITQMYRTRGAGIWARVMVPIYLDGEFAGVTGADLPMDPILAAAGAEDSSGFGALLIYTADGRALLTHASPWTTAIQEEILAMPKTAESDNTLILPHKIADADNTLYAYITTVPHIGWHIAAVAHNKALYEQLTALMVKLSVGAIVFALALVMLIRTSFRQLFIKRVQALEKTTRSFAQHGVANFPKLGKDEIGTLAKAFEELVDSLANREAELTIRNQQLKNEISGRLSAVESLRESERKFRTLFDKSSDAVLVFDGERYMDCNEAAVELLGFNSKAALLSAEPESFHPDRQPDGRRSVDVEREMFAAVRTKGEHRYEWVCRTRPGKEVWVEVVLTLIPYAGREVLYMVWRDITVRKGEEEERIRLATALDQAAEGIVITDTSGLIQYVNPSHERVTQYTREESIGCSHDLIRSTREDECELTEMRRAIGCGQVWKGRVANTRKDGSLYQSETTISPVRDASGAIRNYVIVSYDVTKEATLEAQLIQAQKMEAIGELASGIAHEINTPTQYIGDNIRFFQESSRNIFDLLAKYEELTNALKKHEDAAELITDIDRLVQTVDLEYLIEEIPTAIQQSLEGNTRVAEIVRAMKEFAHPGIEEKAGYDINHGIQNTIAVARNEWKYVADVELNLDPRMPEVPCLPGSFNQVVLNLVVNAAHAIADVVGDGANGKGKIAITTRAADGWAEVRVSDTGSGIPEAIRKKIFDPFFTTKRAGKGTGQGLALVHAVIVDKHNGTIEVESEIGKGTTFVIRIPLADAHFLNDELELAGATTNG